MKEQPFYIGQKVVALDSYNYHGVKFNEGDIFTITGIRKFCKCDYWSVSIGINYLCEIYCPKCNRTETSNTPWLAHFMFAPIEEKFESISFSKVMEEELTSVN